MQGYPIRGRGGGGGVQTVASWVLAKWQAGDDDEPQGTRYTELQSEGPSIRGPVLRACFVGSGRVLPGSCMRVERAAVVPSMMSAVPSLCTCGLVRHTTAGLHPPEEALLHSARTAPDSPLAVS